MSDKQGESISRLYSALSNPYRRQIAQILREKKKVGFKDLHNALKISVGALYHHLDMLEGIVAQDPDRKYVLTDQRRSAIETFSISEEKVRLGVFSGEVLLGRTLLNYVDSDPIRSLPLSILIVGFGAWISSLTRLEPLLLFYITPASGAISTLFMLAFPIGWLVTFGLADTVSTFVFQRRGDDLRLLNGTAFAMLPLLVVPGLFSLAQLLAPGRSLGFVAILLPIFLQAWVVCLLASAVSIAKGPKLERAALISLGVIYLNILILLAGLESGLF